MSVLDCTWSYEVALVVVVVVGVVGGGAEAVLAIAIVDKLEDLDYDKYTTTSEGYGRRSMNDEKQGRQGCRCCRRSDIITS